MYFKDITQQILDKGGAKHDWERSSGGGIFWYVYSAIEFASATIRWFYTGTTSIRAVAKITDWGGW